MQEHQPADPERRSHLLRKASTSVHVSSKLREGALRLSSHRTPLTAQRLRMALSRFAGHPRTFPDDCRLLPMDAGQRKNRSAKQKRVGEVVDPLDLHAGTRVCQRPDQDRPVDHHNQEQNPAPRYVAAMRVFRASRKQTPATIRNAPVT